MIKKTNYSNRKEKTNMYLPHLLKAEFNLKLKQAGYGAGYQATAIRTLMRLFVTDYEITDKFRTIMKEETYITPGGKKSKL